MTRTLIYVLLLAAPASVQALTIPEALSAATGWPLPGREGTWRAGELRGKVPGGFHHGSGLGYPWPRDRHDDPHPIPKQTDCPPAVPIPAAIWLFATVLAGMAIIGRRR